MHEPQITLVGNVGRAPRRRVTAAGVVVTDFRLACTPRKLDKATNTWSDGETTWFGVSCWRSLADHVHESLHTGDRVVVTGRLTTRSWQSDSGETRSGLEVEASSVGVDLAWGPAMQVRRQRPAGEDWHSSGAVDPLTGEVLLLEGTAAAAEGGAAGSQRPSPAEPLAA